MATWTMTLLWTLIVPRALGPKGMGLLVMAWSTSSLLSILGGLSSKTLLVKEIAAHPQQGPGLLGAAMMIRAASVVPCVVLTIAYIQIGHFSGDQVIVLWMAALIAVSILFLEPFQAGFQAIERMTYLAYGEVLNKGLVTVAGIVLVLLGFNGVALVAAMVMAGGVVVALNAFWMRPHLRILWSVDVQAIKSLLWRSLSYWAFLFFYTFYLWIDSTILILMAPQTVVGWYGVSTRLFTTLLFAPMIIVTAWLPRLSAAFSESPAALKAAARAPVELVLTVMLPISVGAALVAAPLIRFLYGPTFAPAAPVLVLLAITLLPMALNMIAYNILVASNRQLIWTGALAGACIFNPALNVLLVQLTQARMGNGAIGAATSLLVTEVVIAVLALIVIREFIDLRVLNRIGRAALATAGMAAIVVMLGDSRLFSQVLAGAATFALLGLLLRLPPEELALASRLKLRRCTRVGTRPQARGRIWVHGGGRVRLGDRVVLDGRNAPIELHAEPGAEIVIGDDVHIEGGASVESMQAVTIGRGSRLGAFSKVIDNHFHSPVGDRQHWPTSTPVELEAFVELGARAIVLPGAHLGRGVSVGPSTVVSRRIPAGAVVSGNPSRIEATA